MTEFTYKVPNEDSYLRGLIEYLNHKDEKDIATLLSGAKCNIVRTSQFSGRARWDVERVEIFFDIPANKLHLATEEVKKKLIGFCDFMMPKEVGFDVWSVDFKPLLGEKRKSWKEKIFRAFSGKK